jgi:hypothetical protein
VIDGAGGDGKECDGFVHENNSSSRPSAVFPYL